MTYENESYSPVSTLVMLLAAGGIGALLYKGFTGNVPVEKKQDERIEACNTTLRIDYEGDMRRGRVHVVADHDSAGDIAEAYFLRDGEELGLNIERTVKSNLERLVTKYPSESKLTLATRAAREVAALENKGCYNELKSKITEYIRKRR